MLLLLRTCLKSRNYIGTQTIRFNKVRTFKTNNVIRNDAKEPATTSSNSAAGSQQSSRPFDPSRQSYKPNNLEKKFLVWTGKYKSVEEVPAFVK